MIALIDWILSLFRSEDVARAFVAAPEQAMRDAGLAGVTAAQLSSVAATAVPGMILGGGDPIVGLQRAVANQYGFEPAYTPSFDPIWAPAQSWAPSPTYAPAPTFAPSPTFAPDTNTELASRNATELASHNSPELASHNTTDLASHNSTPLFSPPQDAGANAQNGAFNLGFGDITLGSKTTQTASGHGVVTGGDSNGDIVSGDGAVLGDANAVTNGDVRADHGANIATGQEAVIHDSGTTTTAGADAISTTDGSVIKGADNDLNSGTVVAGSQTTTTVGGTGNSTTADGHEATLTEVTHTTTTTTTTDNSDSSLHHTTVTDASTHDYSDHSLFDTNLLSNNDTALHSDPSLASGNHLLGLGF